MKLTIVVDDSLVGVDGEFREVVLPDLGDIRAVQWDGQAGHIEYSDSTPNARIDNIDDFSAAIQAWNALTPPPVPPKTLAQARLEKAEEIKAERDRLTTSGGHKIGNFWYHSNEISLIQQLALNGLADKMIASGAPDAMPIMPTPWKTLGGAFVTLTVGIAKNFVQSALTQQGALFSAAQIKIEQVNSLLTIDAVSNYNVKAGFPEVYQA